MGFSRDSSVWVSGFTHARTSGSSTFITRLFSIDLFRFDDGLAINDQPSLTEDDAAVRGASPLIFYALQFGEEAPALLSDYTVPPHFTDDLAACLPIHARNDFRWLVAGPARSGASWHIDPALTCAWNTLLVGKKRWVGMSFWDERMV